MEAHKFCDDIGFPRLAKVISQSENEPIELVT